MKLVRKGFNKKQFKSEIEIFKSVNLIDCPNVLKYYEDFEDFNHSDYQFIITEFCEV